MYRLLPQNQRQSILVVANDDDLSVYALGKIFRGLDSLPFQELRADALRDDLLEVANALGFNALALGFLRFLLQAEVHGQRFLLGLLLGFNRRPQRGGPMDVLPEP